MPSPASSERSARAGIAASIDPETLLRELRGRTDEIVELAARLAGAESPATDPAAQGEAFSILATELETLGFVVEGIPGHAVGDHLLARPTGLDDRAPRQLLLGHLDTVWPLGTLEGMPVRVEEGRLHGPGVYDMKAGLAQMLFALRALAELGASPDPAPVVFVNSDEEIGSPRSREHVERLASAAQRALVLEPSYGPRGQLKTERKGVGRFTVSVTGRASHAGIDPEEGASAILEASHQVQRLFELNDSDRGTTVNVGTIAGGLGANVVAPEVTAAVDVRVRTGEDARRVESAIRALAPTSHEATIEVSGGFERPPLERTEPNRRLWELARRAAAALRLPLEEARVGGASDGNLTSPHTATLDGLGAVGDGAHAPHEHVIVERMPERAALLAMILTMPGSTEGTA